MVSATNVVLEVQPVEHRLSGSLKKVISFPVFLAALLVITAGFQAHLHMADPDTWWHARVGQSILATGHFPRHDIYSFTVRGNPWFDYEWLGDVALGLAGRWGLPGLLTLLGGLSGLLLVLLYIYGTLLTGNVKASFAACAILLPLEAVFFTLRPQVIGYCFLLFLLILLELYRQGHERVLWAIPPLFLVWVNTHGSFFLGLCIFATYWACGWFRFEWGELNATRWTPRQSRNLLLTILASVVALPLTPYGAKLAAYPFEMALLQPLNVANIQEWQPMNLGEAWGKAFLLMILALFIVQIGWKPRFRLFDLVFLVATIGASAVHLRFVIVLIFAFLPWLARFLSRWLTPYAPSKDQYALNVALIGLMAFGLIHFFPTTPKIEAVLGKTYPVQAVAYMQAHPMPAPMYNDYGWGGYLIWTYGTAHPVFIDGRCDIYEYAGVFADYLAISRLGADTPMLLAKYDIRSVFIHSDSVLATYLRAVPGWQLVYQDKVAAIFIHTGFYPQARPRKS
ncbi:MAG TPA: hypothetical protein VGS20_11360 [Candidatus Acidoferrales bacterium]|nr:hypothetical protein [Candidatus Acidoferrales bacterium]